VRPRLLDLFCGAGGAAMGYHRAGFDVVGVDNRPQPNYPFEFVQADALEFLNGGWFWERRLFGDKGHGPFDAIHASPPCPLYSTIGKQSRKMGNARMERHPDLVAPTRELLQATGLPYVIENVPGSPLIDPVTLCGSMFGIDVRRHRLFETNWPLMAPRCQHGAWANTYTQARYHGGKTVTVGRTVGVYGGGQGMGEGEGDLWREAMEIDWMTRREMAQAIPPIYTEYIGNQLLAHIKQEAVA
jgi:DNA (cytosine-5)-methyltransferase 1